MDLRIQKSVVANLLRRPLAVALGPFVLGLDPATGNPGVNYATPLPGAEITPSDVEGLVSAFRAHDRMPRLEYVAACVPGLEALLGARGFTLEARHEYLVHGGGAHVVPPDVPGFALQEPENDADRARLVAAQNEAFGEEPIASDADVARLTRVQEQGGIVLMAVDHDGACAGGGLAVAPHEGVSEIAGIAVRPAFRRRGLGGAVTAGITARLRARGTDLAWLEASGEDSWRVYERIGFRASGKRLYLRDAR
ncbi:GNAT family N-acetyltransferase [Catenuloplanes japonicus]|uniref:GNAT family N-acetyltransferase n=1 Tax=Catenuloplanes japonicus TaxID=33876 RepID=UPI00052555C6|nr:GNAT family N-acetyltransferase [Catenuloplanes japonicus]